MNWTGFQMPLILLLLVVAGVSFALGCKWERRNRFTEKRRRYATLSRTLGRPDRTIETRFPGWDPHRQSVARRTV